MTREDLEIGFTGLTHDHLIINKQDLMNKNEINSLKKNGNPPQNESNVSNLSTIAILRRQPMYDSLVLVKRYRDCLKGFTLEFPTSDVTGKQLQQTKDKVKNDCCKTKLVSVYLDGDDPIYQAGQRNKCKNGALCSEGEIVHVPMNGLLDRLDNYDRFGVAVDSRVYAFAMGLKTAERFLKTSSMKEIQETPSL